jgi:hypothetical protein
MTVESGHSFAGPLVRPEGTGTWVYVDVPFDAAAVFGSRGQIRVRGTVGGAAFRSSLMPRGDGTHYLVVGAELRQSVGAGVGDTVDVQVEPDPEERVMDAPEDLHEALAVHAEAASYWAGLSYSARKEYVIWITGAKRTETRSSRVSKAMALLAQGRKLK